MTKTSLNSKSIKRHEIKDKTVLVRVDYNVPMDPGTTNIADDSRILASIPQIEYLLSRNCKVVLLSHLGRPDSSSGNVGRPDSSSGNEFSMMPITTRLSKILGKPVLQLPSCKGKDVENQINQSPHKSVSMLENIRFEAGETKNDRNLSRALANLADVYINDAFGVAHRAHASTEGITHYIPSYIGFLMQKELDILGKLMSNPDRPMTSIIGGVKASDKMGVLRNLSKTVDTIIIGGGMAATFIKAKDFEVGSSKYEDDRLSEVRDLMENDKIRAELIIPTDVIVADRFHADANFEVTDVDSIPENMIILDIGPRTAEKYAAIISGSSTVIWNGPMGVFEWKNFSSGTINVAKAIAGLKDGTTVVGGGSTADVVSKLNMNNDVTHVSTGGGATLKYLEGKPLPAIEAILKND
ncbi:MAG: phosphoglycerate kinase [Dehalococcoidia bacterium]|nr:phosphoglycerate kinase [Dehalococcoidia bacterium]